MNTDIKINPKKDLIVGRTVDVVKSAGGLALPDSQHQNVTVFAIIDEIGPDVTGYEVGQIVLPHHLNNIFVRGGFHRIIFHASEIWAVVEGLSEDQLSVGGAPPAETSGNGQSEAGATA